MVIPVPLASVVEGDDEQVRTVELFEHPLAVAVAGEFVAQRSAQPIEHRCRQQEAPHRGRLVIEHLVDEVVEDEPIVAGETAHERGGVVTIAERERRELQGGDPSLGTFAQDGGVGGGERPVEGTVEICGDLVVPEPEVGRPHLEQITAGSPPGERSGGSARVRDDEVEPRGRLLDEDGDGVVDGGDTDRVVVVEEHRDVVPGVRHVVDDGGHDGRQRLARLEQVGRLVADPGVRQCGDQVGGESDGVVVVRIEREPGACSVGGGRARAPLAEQGGLPEAGGCRHRA
ncbi:MAG: hypothetical protein R2697_19860 [Ilumatobacteraceae bacterium]